MTRAGVDEHVPDQVSVDRVRREAVADVEVVGELLQGAASLPIRGRQTHAADACGDRLGPRCRAKALEQCARRQPRGRRRLAELDSSVRLAAAARTQHGGRRPTAVPTLPGLTQLDAVLHAAAELDVRVPEHDPPLGTSSEPSSSSSSSLALGRENERTSEIGEAWQIRVMPSTRRRRSGERAQLGHSARRAPPGTRRSRPRTPRCQAPGPGCAHQRSTLPRIHVASEPAPAAARTLSAG